MIFANLRRMTTTGNDSFDWDDLRFVLAVARGGSLSAAARTLGVNHSTVHRRLAGLEGRLAIRLFDRDGGRHKPTAEGADLLASAERVETEMHALGRRLAGRDLRLTGRVSLTAPDDIANLLLPEPLARFRAAYPGVALELLVDNRMLSLTRREADVAIRPTSAPPETLIGRKIGLLTNAVYRRRDSEPSNPGETETAWISWEEGAGPVSTHRWLAGRVPDSAVVYRSNSLLHQQVACRAGIGAALLPSFLGDPDPALVRAEGFDDLPTTDLWLLTHPDLRRTARVRALLDHLYTALREQAGVLAGVAVGDS